MGFDREQLQDAVAQHGRVVRVVIAAVRGSSPREVGAAMLVWGDGQSGTIGGGTLEHHAALSARHQDCLTRCSTHALGPDMGQCCGGSVTLVSEIYDEKRCAALGQDLIARPVDNSATQDMPLIVKRALAQARSQGKRPKHQLQQGWFIEPVHCPQRALWIWGAGHVGRALVSVLSPLPDLAITWVDTGRTRFPDEIPNAVTILEATDPSRLVHHAPQNASHLVLTYSHTLDLSLCNALLVHGFSFAGLIGSATKWARFRSRLRALGHDPVAIDRITCPIGDPALGKHPQMIAVGVASELLRPPAVEMTKKDKRA